MNLHTMNTIAPADLAAPVSHDIPVAIPQTCLHQPTSWLRGLGPLLCCTCAGRTAHELCMANGMLLMSASAEVRAAGPREWLSLEQPGGNIHARFYLLPDTDFCQWDALCALLPCHDGMRRRQRALAGMAQVMLWTRAAPHLHALQTRQLSTPGRLLAMQLACEEACRLEP